VQPESEFVVPMSNLPSFVNDNLWLIVLIIDQQKSLCESTV
jgi:hypothetical protein